MGRRKGALEDLVMNSSAPAKVLITGATGFIGRHCLAPMLGRAWEVHAVTSGGAEQPKSSVTWHRANLLELSDTARLIEEVRPTHLLHLAWDLPAGEWRQAGGHVKWLQASLELLERFAAAGGTRVVMAGTCAEYDWRYGYCSEYRTPVHPQRSTAPPNMRSEPCSRRSLGKAV